MADTSPQSTMDVASRTLSRGIAGVLLTVWLSVTVAQLLEAQPLRSANDRSRWCTVWSLVEDGTYQIDKIRQRSGWDTIDLVKHDDHFYSTKPPLFPTVVAGLYWLEKQTIGWTLKDNVEETARVILLFVNVLPMLLALACLARMLRRRTTSIFTYTFVMATACFGTLLCPFQTVLNNHTPGTVSVIFALCAAIPILADGRRSSWLFAMAGFWAACASCLELPAAAFGVAMFLLLFFADKTRTLLVFVPMALIPLAGFFYTNYLVTGGWKPFYLFYGTEKYEFIHNGIPSYWLNPRGIDQAKDSPLTYFLHCTVGHHGVLSLSPVFLLTLFGWMTFWRQRIDADEPRLPKSIHILGLLLSLVVFGFFMTKTENYNYGGVSVALRWLLWLVPFWLLAIVPLLDAWQPGRVSKLFCVTLLSVSVFSAWYPSYGPWTQPWLFNVMTNAGWIDYSDPPVPKQQPYHSWIRSVPDTEDADPVSDYWIELTGLNNEGRLTTLRIEDAGGLDVGDRRGRRISVMETVEGAEASTRSLTVDVAALKSNAKVEDMLLWPDGEPSPDERNEAVVFLRGLPAERPYAPAKLRYLGSPLRQEAFQTRHAASRVLATPRDHPRPTIYRRDVWATGDVPFGVLEYRITIQDARTGDVVRQSTMRATDAGRVEKFDEKSLIFE